MSDYQAEIPCPHCGFINRIHVPQFGQHRPTVIACDCEEGGCDTYFIYTCDVSVQTIPTVRKIEGIEPRPVEHDPEDGSAFPWEGGAA